MSRKTLAQISQDQEAATQAANLAALQAAQAGSTSSRGKNSMRAIKVRLISPQGQELYSGEYRKPGREGVVKADLKWIANHTTPPLVFVTEGDEYIVS